MEWDWALDGTLKKKKNPKPTWLFGDNCNLMRAKSLCACCYKNSLQSLLAEKQLNVI